MIKKIIHGNELFKTQGFTPAWYYGFAYRPIDRSAEIYYIYPLNWIVRILRKIWFLFSNIKGKED